MRFYAPPLFLTAVFVLIGLQQSDFIGYPIATLFGFSQRLRTDEQIVLIRNAEPLRCGRAIHFRRPEMLAWTWLGEVQPIRHIAVR